MTEKIDVLVVGAGISGIGAGYHLQSKCPDANFIILEGRDKIGGTWDLFKYPGIRSDSDMYTLGFNWSNSCLSPSGTGPEIIRGVLASSINTESTSSTIA